MKNAVVFRKKTLDGLFKCLNSKGSIAFVKAESGGTCPCSSVGRARPW